LSPALEKYRQKWRVGPLGQTKLAEGQYFSRAGFIPTPRKHLQIIGSVFGDFSRGLSVFLPKMREFDVCRQKPYTF